MKNKKKTLLMSLAAVLLVAAGVFGTLAFLTATTNEVTNTFTAGKVSFEDGDKGLDEVQVDEYGVVIEPEKRVTENSYTLIPGHKYTKDPTVHIKEGSEPAFVYVKVTNPIADIEAETTIENQILKNWTKVDGYSDLYKYNETVDAKNEAKSLVVFETFTLAEDASVSEYTDTDTQITVKAFAIQSTNLGDTKPDSEAATTLDATPTTP